MDGFDATYSDSSDHEINEAQHSTLLAAVSELDVKQRVKPPSRKESSFRVSEFHLGKGDADKNTVFIRNLTKSLGQQGSHAVITKQLRSIHHNTRTLPRPLEKTVAARIQRSVGFKNVKSQLGRWDAVVYSNQAASQLSFPLKQSTVTFQTVNDFVSKLKSQTRTSLEQQMDEILNNSPVVQEERKEEEYQLSLAEMCERRREMARLRAQQSYMASKASRQKKIKSKKYHRILRRERIRQQLKDFEVLQKTDPEAALQQLEQLERTRAEERVSLRHRSTGQWARNKAVRAKYNKESRQELAQQLAVSRDLTQKIQVENSSDDEEEEDSRVKVMPPNTDNPWITPKAASEVEEFVSEYRKYWAEHNRKSSEGTGNASNICHNKGIDRKGVASELGKECTENHSAAPANESIEGQNDKGNEEDKNHIQSHSSASVNLRGENNEDGSIDVEIPIREGQRCSDTVINSTEPEGKQVSPKKGNSTFEQINNIVEILPKEKTLSPKKLNHTTGDVNNRSEVQLQKGKLLQNKQNNRAKQENDSAKIVPKWKISSNKQNNIEEEVDTSTVMQLKRKILFLNKEKNISEEVYNNAKIQPRRKRMSLNKPNSIVEQVNKRKCAYSFSSTSYKSKPYESHSAVIATTNSWTVTPIDIERSKVENYSGPKRKNSNKNRGNRIDNGTSKNTVKIGELFDDMEEKLKEKVDKKLKTLKLEFKVKDKNKAENTNSESDDESPSLKFKQVDVQADLDEELNEQPHDKFQEDESSCGNLNKIVRESSLQEREQELPLDNIDPNKFMAMKPKHLQTELPDMITRGDEALDDNEDESEERQMTITEAFAEDDVIAEFRKEKDEVTEKSQPQSVDLSLPGWGEWGGKNLPVSSRKKRRFIIKFPEVAPRKDSNKGSVIINEEKNDKVVPHQVSELPFPFTSVKDFEASIRAPIGNTWIPQTAHRKLIKPSVVTKLGSVIEPMDEDMLVNKKMKMKGMP